MDCMMLSVVYLHKNAIPTCVILADLAREEMAEGRARGRLGV